MNLLKTDRSKENISNTIAEYRTKGAIMRSRTRWHENGEKNTKIILFEFRKKTASKLKTNGDTKITDPKEILEQGKLFYKVLSYTLLRFVTIRNTNYFSMSLTLLNLKKLN